MVETSSSGEYAQLLLEASTTTASQLLLEASSADAAGNDTLLTHHNLTGGREEGIILINGPTRSVDDAPVVLYVAIFITLGGLVIAVLTAFLVWFWCRRLAIRDRRLLEGRCVESAALTEARKKEALFKEIRRDIAAVENDGFLRHLEVYMMPPQQHPHHQGDTGWQYHRASVPQNRHHNPHHHKSQQQHRHACSNHNRNAPSSSSSSSSASNHSQAFLVASPRSGDPASQSLMISRSATMTTTASSISSYSSSSPTGSHRNHIPKRVVVPHHDLSDCEA